MRIVIIAVALLLLSMPIALAQEEDAGAIGPEHGILHAFDRIADNIALFLSRLGGQDSYSAKVREIVAERRAEQLRLVRLKSEGEITGEQFAKMNVASQKQIQDTQRKLERPSNDGSGSENAAAGQSNRPEGSGRP